MAAERADSEKYWIFGKKTKLLVPKTSLSATLLMFSAVT